MGGYQRITLRSKFHKNTDVPVPDANYDQIRDMMTRARTAISVDEPGGLAPTFAQTQVGPNAAPWNTARREHFDDLQTCPAQPTLVCMDRSDAPKHIHLQDTAWVHVVKLAALWQGGPSKSTAVWTRRSGVQAP